ncbi:hypothetical protein ACS0TY_007925 [Phlomoides rotata]
MGLENRGPVDHLSISYAFSAPATSLSCISVHRRRDTVSDLVHLSRSRISDRISSRNKEINHIEKCRLCYRRVPRLLFRENKRHTWSTITMVHHGLPCVGVRQVKWSFYRLGPIEIRAGCLVMVAWSLLIGFSAYRYGRFSR